MTTRVFDMGSHELFCAFPRNLKGSIFPREVENWYSFKVRMIKI
jgi:hypothetical protein